MNLPEWATKPIDERTEADREAWEAWEPTEEEALAVSHATCERVMRNLEARGLTLSFTEIEIEDLHQ